MSEIDVEKKDNKEMSSPELKPHNSFAVTNRELMEATNEQNLKGTIKELF